MDIQELTVAADELSKGQWFLHEPVPNFPVPGFRAWPLKAAAGCPVGVAHPQD